MGQNFLDPKKTNDGKPYGPVRFKSLVKELYLIAKNCYTPYTELLDITPTEKDELINLILEDTKRADEQMAKIKEQHTKNKRNN